MELKNSYPTETGQMNLKSNPSLLHDHLLRDKRGTEVWSFDIICTKNYTRTVTRRKAIELLRAFKKAPRFKRRTPDFIRWTRMKLAVLRLYNNSVLLKKGRYPRTKWMFYLLCRYIAVEFEGLGPNPDPNNCDAGFVARTLENLLSNYFDFDSKRRSKGFIIHIIVSAYHTYKLPEWYMNTLTGLVLQGTLIEKQVDALYSGDDDLLYVGNVWSNHHLKYLVELDDYATDDEDSDMSDQDESNDHEQSIHRKNRRKREKSSSRDRLKFSSLAENKEDDDVIFVKDEKNTSSDCDSTSEFESPIRNGSSKQSSRRANSNQDSEPLQKFNAENSQNKCESKWSGDVITIDDDDDDHGDIKSEQVDSDVEVISSDELLSQVPTGRAQNRRRKLRTKFSSSVNSRRVKKAPKPILVVDDDDEDETKNFVISKTENTLDFNVKRNLDDAAIALENQSTSYTKESTNKISSNGDNSYFPKELESNKTELDPRSSRSEEIIVTSGKRKQTFGIDENDDFLKELRELASPRWSSNDVQNSKGIINLTSSSEGMNRTSTPTPVLFVKTENLLNSTSSIEIETIPKPYQISPTVKPDSLRSSQVSSTQNISQDENGTEGQPVDLQIKMEVIKDCKLEGKKIESSEVEKIKDAVVIPFTKSSIEIGSSSALEFSTVLNKSPKEDISTTEISRGANKYCQTDDSIHTNSTESLHSVLITTKPKMEENIMKDKLDLNLNEESITTSVKIQHSKENMIKDKADVNLIEECVESKPETETSLKIQQKQYTEEKMINDKSDVNLMESIVGVDSKPETKTSVKIKQKEYFEENTIKDKLDVNPIEVAVSKPEIKISEKIQQKEYSGENTIKDKSDVNPIEVGVESKPETETSVKIQQKEYSGGNSEETSAQSLQRIPHEAVNESPKIPPQKVGQEYVSNESDTENLKKDVVIEDIEVSPVNHISLTSTCVEEETAIYNSNANKDLNKLHTEELSVANKSLSTIPGEAMSVQEILTEESENIDCTNLPSEVSLNNASKDLLSVQHSKPQELVQHTNNLTDIGSQHAGVKAESLDNWREAQIPPLKNNNLPELTIDNISDALQAKDINLEEKILTTQPLKSLEEITSKDVTEEYQTSETFQDHVNSEVTKPAGLINTEECQIKDSTSPNQSKVKLNSSQNEKSSEDSDLSDKLSEFGDDSRKDFTKQESTDQKILILSKIEENLQDMQLLSKVGPKEISHDLEPREPTLSIQLALVNTEIDNVESKLVDVNTEDKESTTISNKCKDAEEKSVKIREHISSNISQLQDFKNKKSQNQFDGEKSEDENSQKEAENQEDTLDEKCVCPNEDLDETQKLKINEKFQELPVEEYQKLEINDNDEHMKLKTVENEKIWVDKDFKETISKAQIAENLDAVEDCLNSNFPLPLDDLTENIDDNLPPVIISESVNDSSSIETDAIKDLILTNKSTINDLPDTPSSSNDKGLIGCNFDMKIDGPTHESKDVHLKEVQLIMDLKAIKSDQNILVSDATPKVLQEETDSVPTDHIEETKMPENSLQRKAVADIILPQCDEITLVETSLHEDCNELVPAPHHEDIIKESKTSLDCDIVLEDEFKEEEIARMTTDEDLNCHQVSLLLETEKNIDHKVVKSEVAVVNSEKVEDETITVTKNEVLEPRMESVDIKNAEIEDFKSKSVDTINEEPETTEPQLQVEATLSGECNSEETQDGVTSKPFLRAENQNSLHSKQEIQEPSEGKCLSSNDIHQCEDLVLPEDESKNNKPLILIQELTNIESFREHPKLQMEEDLQLDVTKCVDKVNITNDIISEVNAGEGGLNLLPIEESSKNINKEISLPPVIISDDVNKSVNMFKESETDEHKNLLLIKDPLVTACKTKIEKNDDESNDLHVENKLPMDVKSLQSEQNILVVDAVPTVLHEEIIEYTSSVTATEDHISSQLKIKPTAETFVLDDNKETVPTLEHRYTFKEADTFEEDDISTTLQKEEEIVQDDINLLPLEPDSLIEISVQDSTGVIDYKDTTHKDEAVKLLKTDPCEEKAKETYSVQKSNEDVFFTYKIKNEYCDLEKIPEPYDSNQLCDHKELALELLECNMRVLSDAAEEKLIQESRSRFKLSSMKQKESEAGPKKGNKKRKKNAVQTNEGHKPMTRSCWKSQNRNAKGCKKDVDVEQNENLKPLQSLECDLKKKGGSAEKNIRGRKVKKAEMKLEGTKITGRKKLSGKLKEKNAVGKVKGKVDFIKNLKPLSSNDDSSDSFEGRLVIPDEPIPIDCVIPVKKAPEVQKKEVIATKMMCEMEIQPERVPSIAEAVSQPSVCQDVSKLLDDNNMLPTEVTHDKVHIRTKAQMKAFPESERNEDNFAQTSTGKLDISSLPYSVNNLLKVKTKTEKALKLINANDTETNLGEILDFEGKPLTINTDVDIPEEMMSRKCNIKSPKKRWEILNKTEIDAQNCEEVKTFITKPVTPVQSLPVEQNAEISEKYCTLNGDIELVEEKQTDITCGLKIKSTLFKNCENKNAKGVSDKPALDFNKEKCSHSPRANFEPEPKKVNLSAQENCDQSAEGKDTNISSKINSGVGSDGECSKNVTCSNDIAENNTLSTFKSEDLPELETNTVDNNKLSETVKKTFDKDVPINEAESFIANDCISKYQTVECKELSNENYKALETTASVNETAGNRMKCKKIEANIKTAKPSQTTAKTTTLSTSPCSQDNIESSNSSHCTDKKSSRKSRPSKSAPPDSTYEIMDVQKTKNVEIGSPGRSLRSSRSKRKHNASSQSSKIENSSIMSTTEVDHTGNKSISELEKLPKKPTDSEDVKRKTSKKSSKSSRKHESSPHSASLKKCSDLDTSSRSSRSRENKIEDEKNLKTGSTLSNNVSEKARSRSPYSRTSKTKSEKLKANHVDIDKKRSGKPKVILEHINKPSQENPSKMDTDNSGTFKKSNSVEKSVKISKITDIQIPEEIYENSKNEKRKSRSTRSLKSRDVLEIEKSCSFKIDKNKSNSSDRKDRSKTSRAAQEKSMTVDSDSPKPKDSAEKKSKSSKDNRGGPKVKDPDKEKSVKIPADNLEQLPKASNKINDTKSKQAKKQQLSNRGEIESSRLNEENIQKNENIPFDNEEKITNKKMDCIKEVKVNKIKSSKRREEDSSFSEKKYEEKFEAQCKQQINLTRQEKKNETEQVNSNSNHLEMQKEAKIKTAEDVQIRKRKRGEDHEDRTLKKLAGDVVDEKLEVVTQKFDQEIVQVVDKLVNNGDKIIMKTEDNKNIQDELKYGILKSSCEEGNSNLGKRKKSVTPYKINIEENGSPEEKKSIDENSEYLLEDMGRQKMEVSDNSANFVDTPAASIVESASINVTANITESAFTHLENLESTPNMTAAPDENKEKGNYLSSVPLVTERKEMEDKLEHSAKKTFSSEVGSIFEETISETNSKSSEKEIVGILSGKKDDSNVKLESLSKQGNISNNIVSKIIGPTNISSNSCPENSLMKCDIKKSKINKNIPCSTSRNQEIITNPSMSHQIMDEVVAKIISTNALEVISEVVNTSGAVDKIEESNFDCTKENIELDQEKLPVKDLQQLHQDVADVTKKRKVGAKVILGECESSTVTNRSKSAKEDYLTKSSKSIENTINSQIDPAERKVVKLEKQVDIMKEGNKHNAEEERVKIITKEFVETKQPNVIVEPIPQFFDEHYQLNRIDSLDVIIPPEKIIEPGQLADFLEGQVLIDELSTTGSLNVTKPDTPPLDFDETPLSEKVKKKGSFSTKALSGTQTAIGGPFLSEPVYIALKPIVSGPMDNSPGDSDADYPFSVKDNSLGFFIENNLQDECLIDPNTGENMFIPNNCKEEIIEHEEKVVNYFTREQQPNPQISDDSDDDNDDQIREVMSVEKMNEFMDNSLQALESSQSQQIMNPVSPRDTELATHDFVNNSFVFANLGFAHTNGLSSNEIVAQGTWSQENIMQNKAPFIPDTVKDIFLNKADLTGTKEHDSSSQTSRTPAATVPEINQTETTPVEMQKLTTKETATVRKNQPKPPQKIIGKVNLVNIQKLKLESKDERNTYVHTSGSSKVCSGTRKQDMQQSLIKDAQNMILDKASVQSNAKLACLNVPKSKRKVETDVNGLKQNGRKRPLIQTATAEETPRKRIKGNIIDPEEVSNNFEQEIRKKPIDNRHYPVTEQDSRYTRSPSITRKHTPDLARTSKSAPHPTDVDKYKYHTEPTNNRGHMTKSAGSRRSMQPDSRYRRYEQDHVARSQYYNSRFLNHPDPNSLQMDNRPRHYSDSPNNRVNNFNYYTSTNNRRLYPGSNVGRPHDRNSQKEFSYPLSNFRVGNPRMRYQQQSWEDHNTT